MSWTVDDIYKLTRFLTKQNQSGSISATDLCLAWNTEQHAFQSDLLGKWQNRNNGKTGANTGLVLNETVSTLLAPFTLAGSITLASGKATKPAGFVYELAMRLLVSGTEHDVTKINHGQIIQVNKDVIDTPSTTDHNYYAVEYEAYYQFLPVTAAGALKLDYITACTDIVWGFTYDVDGRQVYNVGTSVQPKWDTPSIVEITKRSLANLGVSFKDNDFSQFGKANIVTGDS